MDPYHVTTIYTDPRTIYTQPTPYDPPDRPQPRPQPAAPAASIQPELTPTIPTPTTPAVWQRQHRQQLATRTSQSVAPTPSTFRMNSMVADLQVGNVVYQSLQRPKLLRGGEWQLSVVTNLIAALFVLLAVMSWNWRFLPGALFFGGPIQWLLRVMAARDPKRWQKYIRTVRQPLVREPHGKPDEWARPPQILPKPSWFIH